MAARGGAPMSKWKQDALVALQGKLKENLTMTQLCDMLEKPAGGFMSHAEAIRVTELSGDSNQVGQIIKILRGKGDNEFDTFCKMLRCCNYDVWANKLESEAETFKNGQDSPDEKQSRVDKLEDEVKVVKQTLAVTIKVEGAQLKHIIARLEQLEQQMQAWTSQANQRANSVQISEKTVAENVMDPNETPEAIRAAYKLIVAVDIGMAYTKVAWCQTKFADPKPYLFIDGQWEDQRQVPTAVLYKLPAEPQHRCLHWEFHSFGHEAIEDYSKGKPKENESWALFRKFKMELDNTKDFGKDFPVSGSTRTAEGQSRTVTLPALKVFRDILLHIKDIVLDYIRKHGVSCKTEDIKWVLTVPAMWRASARHVMRQAAKEAQIYQTHASRQVAIALEPESAALHVRSLLAGELIMGNAVNAKRYIVIDIGGGMIDVAVHAVVCHADSGEEYVHELEGRIGSANGATVINKKFEDFLCDLDIPGYPKVFSEMRRNPQVWTALMDNFETTKVKYKGAAEMVIEMPGCMFVQYQEKTRQILKSLVQHKSPRVYIAEGYSLLHISTNICLEWYEPTISSTVELIRELNAKHHLEALFVVGGFAKCKILHQRLEKEFPTLKLVVPEDPGFAVIKGAVRYGPLKAIASRTSYATCGIDCPRPFRDGDDPSKKIWSEKHQSYYCKDTFSAFVTRGQKYNPAAPYTKTYNPMRLDQTSVSIAIYATDAPDPKYVTDPGCVKIGTVSIDIVPLPARATAADDNREVTVKMDFSGPEIFITADDNTRQYHSERTVDCLPLRTYVNVRSPLITV